MLKSLIRGKFIGSRSVNNPPEHFVNNQVLTVGIAPYASGKILPFIGGPALTFRGPLHTRPLRRAPSPSRRGLGIFSYTGEALSPLLSRIFPSVIGSTWGLTCSA